MCSLTGSDVVVLNRNNSQNRLEAATPVDPETPLGRSVQQLVRLPEKNPCPTL